jgi:DNA-binding transcriptional regulator GbsR (MarR family)
MNDIGILLLDEPMSLKEIAEELDIKEKKAYSLIKKMFKEYRVNSLKADDGQRKYRNTEENAERARKLKERRAKRKKK